MNHIKIHVWNNSLLALSLCLPHLCAPPQGSDYTGLQCSLTLQCQIQGTLRPLILYTLPTLVHNTVVNAFKGTTNVKLLHPGKHSSINEG